MPAPSAVVFDLGNVLLTWDRARPYRALMADDAAVDDFLTRVLPMDWHATLDAGRPWDDALAERIALYPGHEALIRAYRTRFSETIPGAIGGTVAILESLAAQGIPLYALTNFPVEVFDETRDRFDFFRHFRGIVVSGYEKVMKPDPEIFRRLTARYDIRPQAAAFIDDLPANVAAATACGFTGLHFTGPEKLAADLSRLGLAV